MYYLSHVKRPWDLFTLSPEQGANRKPGALHLNKHYILCMYNSPHFTFSYIRIRHIKDIFAFIASICEAACWRKLTNHTDNDCYSFNLIIAMSSAWIQYVYTYMVYDISPCLHEVCLCVNDNA